LKRKFIRFWATRIEQAPGLSNEFLRDKRVKQGMITATPGEDCDSLFCLKFEVWDPVGKGQRMSLRSGTWFLAIVLVAFNGKAAEFVDLMADIQTVRWVNAYKDKPGKVDVVNWTTHCVVGTNSWLIEQEGAYTKDAWWFTGSNVVVRTVVLNYPSDRPELFARNHPDIVVGREYTKTVDVRQGAPPYGPFIIVGEVLQGTANPNIPWLAFCSGPYLKSEGGSVRPPFLDQSTWYMTCSNSVAAFPDTLGLPSGIEFYSTNQPLCHYRTVGSTKVQGWNFPLEFHMAQYGMDFTTHLWEVRMTVSGKVTGIGVGREPSLAVEDKRTAFGK
jgi:hypothetical protein